MIETLTEWGNQDFFLDIFLELQERIRKASGPNESNLAGSMSVAEVRESISNSLGTNNELGSVFDASILSYKERLLEPSSELLVQAFKYSFSPLFRPYITRAQWTTVGEVDDSGTFFLVEIS